MHSIWFQDTFIKMDNYLERIMGENVEVREPIRTIKSLNESEMLFDYKQQTKDDSFLENSHLKIFPDLNKTKKCMMTLGEYLPGKPFGPESVGFSVS